MKNKKKSNCTAIMSQIVLPNDTNPLGILRGGTLLHWMDILSVICAEKYTSKHVVTSSVFNVTFYNPVKLGDTVTIESRVSRAFNTSLEIFVEVWAENISKKKCKCSEAFYTFVALNGDGKTDKIEPFVPESEEDKRLYIGAGKRRELQLLLAGKLNRTKILKVSLSDFK